MDINGGKLIGEGSNTCVFKPNIPCPGIDIDKICATSEFAFSQFGKKPLSRVYQALEAKRQNTT